MIIIGEKINGSIPKVGEAIANRDADFIRELAKRQTECHADFLDVAASVAKDQEEEVMAWLIGLVQEVTDVPICIDSPDPETIAKVFPLCERPGMINSISAESGKCETLLPLIEGTDWQVLAQPCDDHGIPSDSQRKIELALGLIERAGGYGIVPERIHVDPLVMSLSSTTEAMISFIDTIKGIREVYPTVQITSGLSNVSYSLPYRKAINMNFLSIAVASGMTSAIMDSTNRDMYTTILAAECIMGKDRFCRTYIKAYRKGEIGPIKN